jgi:hypothetical protein
MKSFGQIKTIVESSLINSYTKESFKNQIKEFKKHILDDKQISEMYFLYDTLSKPSGFNKEIASEYVNESTDLLKTLIEKNASKIESLSKWVDTLLVVSENEYETIDAIVYNKSVKNLDKVVESKKTIKNIITSEKQQTIKESVNIPLSSMLKIASNVFNENFQDISESEKDELKSLLSLNKQQTSQEVKTLSENIIEKLNGKLVEETDDEIKQMLNTTINRVKESKNDLVSLYKLKKLDSGL